MHQVISHAFQRCKLTTMRSRPFSCDVRVAEIRFS
jgi:hypothetical protein